MKKLTLILFLLSFSWLSSVAQTKVLYYCDAVLGIDQMAVALTNQGCAVTYVNTDALFQAQIATPANFDIAIYFCQANIPDPVSVNALVGFVLLGKTGMYLDWSNNAPMGVQLGVNYTGNMNQAIVQVTDPQLAAGLPANPFLLSNPGWGIFSYGLIPLPGGVPAGFYTGNGEFSIIKTFGGKMLVFGFLNDLFPTSTLFENAIIMLSPSITTSSFSGTFCEGATLNVNYTVNGIFNPGNIFTAQLSDATGSFASPVSIGTLVSTGNGTINCTIPMGTPAGAAYRIRVVSSDPAITGSDNANNIIINTFPVLTCPADIVVSNDAGFCGAVVTYMEMVTGSPAPTITYSQASGTFFPIGITTVTVTATNSCGTDVCSFDITVNDNELPVITCPTDIIASADSGACISTGVVLVAPITSDNCGVASVSNDLVNNCIFVINMWDSYGDGWNGGSLTVNIDGSFFGNYSASGYSSTANINLPNGSTIDFYYNSGSWEAENTYSIELGGTVVHSAGPNPPTGLVYSYTCNNILVFPVGNTIVTWTVTDIYGNTNTCAQNITITDDEIPSVTCGADISQTNDPGVCEAYVTVPLFNACDVQNGFDGYYQAANWNLVNTNGGVGYVDASAAPGSILMYGGDNYSTNNSETRLEITIPCDGQLSYSWDYQSYDVSPQWDPMGYYLNGVFTLLSNNSGPLVQSGFASIPVLAGDVFSFCLRSDNWNFGYPNASLMISSNFSAPINGSISATDNCGIASIVNDYNGSNDASDIYPEGTTTVTWTITDVNGNTNSCSQDITVTDDEIPVITCAADQTQTADPGLCQTSVTVIPPTTSDNCGVLSLVNSFNGTADASGTYPVGITPVTWTITDIHGNTNTCIQNIEVTDDELPVITCAPDQTQTADPGVCGANVIVVAPITSDNCGAILINDYNGTSNASDFYPVGITVITWTITDFSGNSSSCLQNIEVTDDEVPTISCPFSPFGAVRPADPGVCEAYIIVPLPIVSDNCGIASVINDFNGTSDASDDYPVGITTVTWTVTDINGNSSTCQDFINVIDNQPPTVATQDITVYLNSNGLVAINPTDVDNGSTDNCAIINWTLSQSVFGCVNVGPNTVTLTITDVNGNQGSGTAVVTVVDTIAPIVFCNNITVQLDVSGNVSITAAQVFNGAYDACGIGTMSVVPNSFTCNEVGPNTVTLTINDIYGNQSTCTSTVTVEDNVPPVALCQNITVQLDATGNVTITPAQIDNGSNDVCGIASLSVFPNTLNCANLGSSTVTLTVTDINGNVSTCTATVTVEDITPPWAFCKDLTLQLDFTGNVSITADMLNNGSFDECGFISFSADILNFTCAHVGENTVIMTVTDNSGNSSFCMSTVTVEDNIPPVALCQDITIQLDETGHASITVDQVDNGSGDACGIDFISIVPNAFSCANVGANTVTLTLIDNNGNTSSCTSTVTVEDITPPVAICQDITLQLDDMGNVSITGADIGIASNDACGIASLIVTPDAFTCANVGNNTVVLTVTDVNGNISSCTSIVTVEDITVPDAICQNITVQLDATGNVSITPDQVDNGSNDACGIGSLSVAPNTFTCANVGSNFVFLTVTDVNGNIDVCLATVTVEDNVPPIAICQNITIQLDALGNASINASQIDNGSNDACGIASLSVSPNTFSCYNVGSNTVTLTVTDVNGNVSSCTSTVTVQDVTPPIAICQNITIQLDALGNASITAAQIDNGSNDACGIASLVVSPDAFTCANVGTNTVILAVTDVNGNVSSCSATVTVQDNIAPVAICQNITAQLDILGNVTITGAQVDNGSNDACGIASLVVLPNTFTCANVGTNPVILTVTDVNGNVSSCSATVTVEDNVPPAAICQNITVYLDQAGNTSIVPADIDNGSNDACGIASLSVQPNFFTCANVGSNIVILTVTDVNGNVSTCISELTVADTIPPTVFCPADITVNSAPGACDYTNVELGFPTFFDNCLFVGVTNNALITFPIGITPVTWTVTDGSGNITTCIQNVNVESTPLAVNDTVITAESTPIEIAVLANDIDCGNNLDPASLQVVSGPANGSVTIDLVNGTITYTPDYLFTGMDQFNYQICDSAGLCSIATVFIEVLPVNNPVLGVAKAVFSVTPQPDNSFDIIYVITVENLGNDLIENIQVTDDLASVFHAPAIYTIIDPPNTNNNLTPNFEFNGSSDMNLLESNSSFLDVGNSGTITFTIHVHLLGSVQTFCNSAIATGRGSMGSFVSDTSDNGYISDANGNKNPGDPGENDCTPLTLTPNDVFIPQAFSPDGDAINDYFVIAGIELYPNNEITIFNRWGNKVFNMTRYDNTWDAKPNQQLNMGSNKVPEGTYYYIFEYNKEDREPRTGFVVIKY